MHNYIYINNLISDNICDIIEKFIKDLGVGFRTTKAITFISYQFIYMDLNVTIKYNNNYIVIIYDKSDGEMYIDEVGEKLNKLKDIIEKI
jgi:hypothetical protein